jgi:hypothetical protein
MTRSFKTRTFARWANKADLSDATLLQAVEEMSRGLVDADLGGHVVKKRVALPGQGKRGGARVIVATKLSDRWFFLFGFSKNEQDNIDSDDLRALRETAGQLLAFTDQQLLAALAANELTEIDHGG